jgi:hypothetical protein
MSCTVVELPEFYSTFSCRDRTLQLFRLSVKARNTVVSDGRILRSFAWHNREENVKKVSLSPSGQ